MSGQQVLAVTDRAAPRVWWMYRSTVRLAGMASGYLRGGMRHVVGVPRVCPSTP